MVAAKKHRKYFNTPILLTFPTVAWAAAEKVLADAKWGDYGQKADLQKASENGAPGVGGKVNPSSTESSNFEKDNKLPRTKTYKRKSSTTTNGSDSKKKSKPKPFLPEVLPVFPPTTPLIPISENLDKNWEDLLLQTANSESAANGKNSGSDKKAQNSESDNKGKKSENYSKDESSERDTNDENLERDDENENFESDDEDKDEGEDEDEDESSESDTEDNNNCSKCVRKTYKIQRLTLSNEKAKSELEDLEESYYFMKANEQMDNADYSENYRNWFGLKSKIIKLETEAASAHRGKDRYSSLYASAKKALEKSNAEAKVELEKMETQLQTEVASKKSMEKSLAKYQKLKQLVATKIIDNEDQGSENYVEWFELNSKIQALEMANDEAKNKLETEAASAKIALEKLKAEAKVELEKVENKLQTEVASKKSLEDSLAKYQKLKQLLATKIFQSNPSNEDLIALLNLEIEKLFEKYEEVIIRFNQSDSVKVEEEIDCTVKDKKLDLQILQRELYEKELDAIMDVLKMPSGDRNYTGILPMIKDLLQQVDTDHCTNAVENLINMNE